MRIQYTAAYLRRRSRELSARTIKITLFVGLLLTGTALVGQLAIGRLVFAGTTTSGEQTFRTSSYRLYQNANSLTPGAPLAAVDTPATLAATGDSFRLKTGFKSEMTWKQIAGAYENMCGIAEDGKVYCWGRNYEYALGTASVPEDGSTVPVAVDWSGVLAGKTARYLAGGGYNFCVIASDDHLYCWGANWSGALGIGKAQDDLGASPTPVAVDTTGVLAGKTITSLDMSENFVCVTASDQNAYCWGDNRSGYLGNAGTADSSVPVAVDTSGVLSGKKLSQIAVGSFNTCALSTEGKAYCWGGGSFTYMLGVNSTQISNVPVAVDTSGVLAGKTIVELSAYYNGTTCALTSDNKIYCWGENGLGSLGNGTLVDSPLPTPVDMSGALAGKTITGFARHDNYSDTVCVFDTLQDAYCWGMAQSGQLANNASAVEQKTPVLAYTAGSISGKTVASLGFSLDTGCAVATDRTAHCSGLNWWGQAGNGTRVDTTPFANTIPIASTGAPIAPNTEQFSLEYAVKTAATCEVQTTGFAPVTQTSAIAYNDNASVMSGQGITADASDPVVDPFVKTQNYVENGTFSNNTTIDPATYGLWDFSLRDNNALSSTDYCIRIAHADGQVLGLSTHVAQVTTAPGREGAPTIGSVVWKNDKPLATGTYEPTNTAKLEVVFDGKTYTLGVDPELTATGSTWTLDLASATFQPGTYTILVRTTPLTGQILSAQTDTELVRLASSQSPSPSPSVTQPATPETKLANTGLSELAIGVGSVGLVCLAAGSVFAALRTKKISF